MCRQSVEGEGDWEGDGDYSTPKLVSTVYAWLKDAPAYAEKTRHVNKDSVTLKLHIKGEEVEM